MLRRKTLMVALAGVLGTGITGTAMADSGTTADQKLEASKLDQNYENSKADQSARSDQNIGSDQKLEASKLDQNYENENAGSKAATTDLAGTQSSQFDRGDEQATPVYGETMVLIVPDQPSGNQAMGDTGSGAASTHASPEVGAGGGATSTQGPEASGAPVRGYYRRETVILVPQPGETSPGATQQGAGDAGAAGLHGSTGAEGSPSAGAEPALGPTTQFGTQGVSSADSATLFGGTSGSTAPAGSQTSGDRGR